MSLIWLEGFETGTLYKWDFLDDFNISTVARTGVRSLASSNNFFGSATAPFPSTTTAIVGTAFRHINGVNDVIQLQEDGVTTHVTLSFSANTWTVTAGGSVIGTFSTTIPALVWVYVELKTTIDDVTGSVEVRINGSPVFNFGPGDTQNGGSTTVNKLRVSRSSGFAALWDDMYICNDAGSINNDFLGDLRVHPVFPDGNGTYSEFVGSDGNSIDNYQLVDEFPSSTLDYVASPVTGSIDTYQFENRPDGTIFGFEQKSFAAKSDDISGPQQFRHFQRVNGTDYPVAIDHAPSVTGSYGWFDDVIEVSPDTGILWTVSEFNTTELGFEVRP